MLRKIFLLVLIGLGTWTAGNYVQANYTAARRVAFGLNGLGFTWGMVGMAAVLLVAMSMLSSHKGRR